MVKYSGLNFCQCSICYCNLRKEELTKLEIPTDSISAIMQFITIKGEQNEVIEALKQLKVDSSMYEEGVAELEQVVAGIRGFGVPDKNFRIDLTIARGLDYYTGTIYETILNDYPEMGSVCSGGRYDNLAEYYTNKKLPGVGISIGLTRLFSQLLEIGLIKTTQTTPIEVLVVPMGIANDFPIEVVSKLKQKNISATIIFDTEAIR